jgi:hypothetical protein
MSILYRRKGGGLFEVKALGDVVEIYTQGGGFVRRISREVFERDFAPAGDIQKPRKGLATGHWLNGRPLQAYYSELNWNGWLMPYFERDDLLQAIKSQPGMSNVTYDEKDDQFIAFMGADPDKATPEEREELTERYPAQQVETIDGIKTLYALGAGSWCWEEYSEDQAPEGR